MSIQRSQLGRSPAIVTYNGATLFTRTDFKVQHAPQWKPVTTSMYDEVDKTKEDLTIKIELMLWGAYENLAVLFPASVLNPNIGSSIYGAADLPLVIQAKNNDTITYTNAALTRVSDLLLGVDSDLFAAAVEFTAILGQGHNPEDAGAYFTLGASAYSDGAFSKTNFKRTRYTGVWGNFAGWGEGAPIAPQKGFHVGWTLDLAPVLVDGLGTVDMTLKHFRGAAKFIPIGPTMAQINAQSQISTPHGTLASGTVASPASADLVMTGNNNGPVITLKNAFLAEHGFEFGIEPLRVGEVALETITGFAGGVPAPIATVA